MKKFFFVSLFLFTLILVPAKFYAEDLSLPAHYNSPFGSYKWLHFVPRAALTNPCSIGTLYSVAPGELKYCADNGSGVGEWVPITSVWRQTNNDEIFPVNTLTNPLLRVGIGTSVPEAINLHVHEPSFTVDWTDTNSHRTVGKTLYDFDEFIISSPYPKLTLVSNSILGMSRIVMSEVDGVGNYTNKWYIARPLIGFMQPDKLYIGYKTSNPFRCYDDYHYQKLIITEDGKVGIGAKLLQTTPQADLHVRQNGEILLENSTVGIEFRDTDNDPFKIAVDNDALRIQADSGSGWEDAMFFKSDKNIGIGTTDPHSKLHVQCKNENTLIDWSSGIAGSLAVDMFPLLLTGTDPTLNFIGEDHTSALSSLDMPEVDAAGKFTNTWSVGRKTTFAGGKFYISYVSDSDPFGSHSHQAMNLAIQPNGNVGIGRGNAGPQENLHIKGGGEMALENTSTAVEFISSVAGEDSFRIGAWADFFGFETDTGAGWTDLMRVMASGRVGINRTAPAHKLDVGGTIHSTTSSSSDIRLKKNITPIKNALNRVIQLQGVTYYWKDAEASPDMQLGMIAQDVEKIFPEVVLTDNEGYKSIAYGKFTAALIEATKEMEEKFQTEIEQIEKINNRIKKGLHRQRMEIAELEEKIK